MDILAEIKVFFKKHPSTYFSHYDIARGIHRSYQAVEGTIKSNSFLFDKETKYRKNKTRYFVYRLKDWVLKEV